jgi:hypothetical protein
MAAMGTNRFQRLTLPLAAASLALAACGGGESTAGSGDSRAQFREAALRYAECMRRHGVDVPDPSPGKGGGILMAAPRSGEDMPTVQRAEEACRKHLESVRPPELSEEQKREFREQALKHARCMREHGIDIPDPTFGEGGRVEQRLGGGIDPREPAFQEAEKACSRFGPKIEEGS